MSTTTSAYWTDALGLEIRMHDVAGVRTRCITGGDGAPTLFLHGIQASAENHIRNLRPPDSYHGKGVRYAGEHVRLKAGKAAAR